MRSTIRLKHVTLRETAMELIHKGRLLRILINRSDGPVGTKEREAVLAFIAGLELASP